MANNLIRLYKLLAKSEVRTYDRSFHFVASFKVTYFQNRYEYVIKNQFSNLLTKIYVVGAQGDSSFEHPKQMF